MNKEIFEKCKEYFNGDDLAASVIINKYLLKDSDGNFIEKSPESLIKRISSEFSRIEKKYPNSLSEEEIFEALNHFKYIIPQGSPLFGIGNEYQTVSIANCFVVDRPADSYGGILNQDQELAQIMKRRGGVGIDISTIRPKGSVVNNAARTSDGITCFMERFSNTTKEVAQGGRRGALLISIDCRHPNLEEFITVKNDLTRVTGANISIKWSDEFLKCVEEDKEYVLRYPVDSTIEEAKITKTIKAKEIWEKFVIAAHTSAEPGCLYWDKMVTQSLGDCYPGFETISTNPCSEIGMSAYSSCILMAMNLTGFVDNPFTNKAIFNKTKFKKYLGIASRLIDDMIDLELEKCDKIIKKIINDPESNEIKLVELKLWEKIKKTYIDGRRVGLGFTGLADTLAMLGLKYASPKSLEQIEEIMKNFHFTLSENQAILAKERGSFSVWDWKKESNCHYNKILPKRISDLIQQNGRRNISFSTCAPAGSISLLAQISSGIEPVFMLEYKRNRKLSQEEIDQGIKEEYIDPDGIKWTSCKVFHPGLKQWKQINPKKSIEKSPYFGCTASELNWKDRVKLQGLIQQYITHSISSTCNLPKNVSEEEVSDLYLTAWKEGCKGITIYRDGSRKGVLESNKDKEHSIFETTAPFREKSLPCDIHYSTIQGNNWIFFVGLFNGRPYEIFGGQRTKIEIPKKYKTGWILKNGRDENGRRTYSLYLGTLEESDERLIIKDIASEFSPDVGSYTRIISTMLRHGVPIKIICEQLYKDSGNEWTTFEKGCARVLKKYIKDGEKAGGICENCKSDSLQYRDGCVICVSCGASKCL